MARTPVYHEGSRSLQDAFDSRRIADRLEQVTYSEGLDGGDRAMIDQAAMFFLATADAEGRPDCSYKGGLPGFVRVLGPREIAWPDFDGNGQFRSLGNIRVNPNVGLLFVDWARPSRLRINGRATVSADDPLLRSWERAQLVVRVQVEQVFPNCPRYIHRMTLVEHSAFVPRQECEPPRPGWKDNPSFADALPAKDLRR
jgi:predicted pyridoxine 5'-phosphate oxidase superfamily flavin-nucleotide-binding protein